MRRTELPGYEDLELIRNDLRTGQLGLARGKDNVGALLRAQQSLVTPTAVVTRVHSQKRLNTRVTSLER